MFQLVKRQQRMWKETWTIEPFCYVLHFNSTTKVGQPVLAFDLVVESWLLWRFNHMNLICWWYCSDSWQIWEWSTPQHGIVCCQRSWTWFFTIQAWITNQAIYNASTILINNPHKSRLKPGNTTTVTFFSSLRLAPRRSVSRWGPRYPGDPWGCLVEAVNERKRCRWGLENVRNRPITTIGCLHDSFRKWYHIFFMAMVFFNENLWWWDPPSHELPKNGWVTCWEYWMWVPSGSNQKFHQRGRSQYLHRITGRPLVFQLFLVCFAYMIIHDLRISIRLWHSFFMLFPGNTSLSAFIQVHIHVHG